MRIFGFLAYIAALSALTYGQYSSRQQLPSSQGSRGQSWDIRLAVPGEPGADYPTHGAIPRTSFSCAGKKSGYYADLETNCQVFRVCTLGSTYGFQSFLCPNGTLFNQQVFVCDWWMNVKCEASEKYFTNNNDKFGNLKLGPQMVNDIKKMLTHPMRTPYDKTIIKSKYVVMQEYKPPSGQLIPNAALRAGYERSINNIASTKQLQSSFNQNYNGINDNVIVASTPSSQYVPAPFNNGQNIDRDVETFQREIKSGRYVQSNENPLVQTKFSNAHSGRITQAGSVNGNSNTFNTAGQNHRQNEQYNIQKQLNAYSTQNTFTNQRNQQNSQFRNNRIANQGNGLNQAVYGVSFKKEQYTVPSQQNTLTTATRQNQNDISGQVKQTNEAKENLVSDLFIPTTVITKTLTFDRLLKTSKQENPSSRLTFKTWIIRPAKTARLIEDTTPYVYDKPTNPSQTAKLISESTPYYYNKPPMPYVYDKPTNPPQPAKLKSEPTGYYYNKPLTTQSEKLVSESGYVYNKPILSARLITSTEPSRFYLVPTTIRPTLAGRLYLAPTTPKPTAARLYIPPSQNPISFSPQPVYDRNADLQVSPTTPTAVYLPPQDNNSRKPTFTFTKQSRVNTNHNNLTFTDILTKEKLDITVHDIVKDTSKILDTVPSNELGQLREGNKDAYYPEENFLPPDATSNDNVETIGLVDTQDVPRSGKLVVSPSTDLEPPIESLDNNNQNNNNPIANLPFYTQTSTVPTNTIERTVSLKISIPEKTAKYLFNENNDDEFDKLEILNTGSSNYLVLTNNNLNKVSNRNFIPIGKLVVDKNSNVSNSQALVYSFLADSLNVAKEYNNIVDQNLKSQSQFQNVNNEDLSQITNKVSQLTSTQYGHNNLNTNSNTPSSDNYKNIRGDVKFSNSHNEKQIDINRNTQVTSSHLQSSTLSENSSPTTFTQNNNRKENAKLQEEKQIYSGQLYQIPVPDTSHIYNEQSEENFVALTNKNTENNELEDLQRVTNVNSKNNAASKESSAEVEIIKSHSFPFSSPAKLQEAPKSGINTRQSQEDNTAQQIFSNFIKENGLTAQLKDKIVGTIPHPLEENKVVSYKKDQSYYLYTNLNNIQNQRNGDNQKSGKLIQSNNAGNVVTLQFIPSVSYQVDDARDQEKLLNTFQINEFGRPKEKLGNANAVYQNHNRGVLTSDVNYSVDHARKEFGSDYRNSEILYTGPSSYSAPQASVGQLQQQLGKLIANPYQNNNNNYSPARLEQFNEGNGYQKHLPTRQFTFN